jgi:toxin ParE1/3/4
VGFQVVLTEDAERDQEDVFTYIAQHDSRQSAERVLSQLLEVAESLAIAPTRGSQPKELRAHGDQEFRQVFFRPYRLIHRVVGQRPQLT